jgi:hypothetical protein
VTTIGINWLLFPFMKTPLALACVAGLLIVGALSGQDAPPTAPTLAPEQPEPASQPVTTTTGLVLTRGSSAAATAFTQRGAGSGAAHPSTKNYPPLSMNVAVNVKGNFMPGVPLDLTMTGCGPDFAVSQILSEVEISSHQYPCFGSCKISIVAVGGGYRLEYEVGSSIPEPNASSNIRSGVTAMAITYRPVSTKSSVILKMGQNLTVTTSIGQDLTFSLCPAP